METKLMYELVLKLIEDIKTFNRRLSKLEQSEKPKSEVDPQMVERVRASLDTAIKNHQPFPMIPIGIQAPAIGIYSLEGRGESLYASLRYLKSVLEFKGSEKHLSMILRALGYKPHHITWARESIRRWQLQD